MGFAKGYVKGKVYALGVGVVMAVGMVVWIDAGGCEPKELEVGDKVNCLVLVRDVEAGEKLDMEMLELRETTVDSPDFACISNILGFKGNQFSEDTAADTVLRYDLLDRPGSELDEVMP